MEPAEVVDSPSAEPTESAPAVPTPPAVGSRRSRTLLLAAAIIGAFLLVGGTSIAVLRPGPVAGWLGLAPPSPTPSAVADPTPGPVLAGLAVDTPMPTTQGLTTAFNEVIAGSGLGGRLHISVLDMATGTVLFSQDPTAMTTPASTTKIVTAVAVLAATGPAHQIATRVVAGAQPGEVVLVGGGDPTLAIDGAGFYSGAARLDELAAATRAALGGTTPTKVTIDASLFSGPAFGPGWDDDIPTGGYAAAITALMIDGGRTNPKAGKGWAQRAAAPDLAAGRAFARALGLPPEAVGTAPAGYAEQLAGSTGQPTGSTGEVANSTAPSQPVPSQPAGSGTEQPIPGAELARVESPPMISLVETMLSESDNVVAEALARQVAIAQGEPASFAGAAAAMDAVLTDLGLPAEQSDLSDGSGLSRNNRLTPGLLTELTVLAGSGSRPELAGLFSGLPVAAWSGTLQGRYQATAAPQRVGAGVVRAKTGSLSGVNSLAGTVTTADGRLLAFAVLADAVPSGPDQAQAALDRIAATLASCGCR
ncbi:D-alanyl-D-alanine carboxypeptidase/D-alanyl-D-alanine endopeptidase [Micromonospora sp. NBC_01813]|uniref:D-alanyl-D-alanine carboxypeptidase/D-alanyl-D-alanine endopeptidase n=1 Tax=Micromonospora sp. NBC_01813 TaxID=2975988 RepID=UPI003FA38AAA